MTAPPSLSETLANRTRYSGVRVQLNSTTTSEITAATVAISPILLGVAEFEEAAGQRGKTASGSLCHQRVCPSGQTCMFMIS